MSRFPAIFGLVGDTPLAPLRLRTPRGGHTVVHLKLEGSNPTGSVKDRAARAMLCDAVESGRLQPGMVLLDASSGNMACSLSAMGAALGHEVAVVCNGSLTTGKRRFIEHFGARLIANDYGPYTYDGYRKCLDLLEARGERFFFLDQLHNWCNPQAHQSGTGPEILHDLPDVRMIVGSIGSGGTMLGVSRAVRSVAEGVRIIAVVSAPGSRLPGVGVFDDGDYRTPFVEAATVERAFDATIPVTVRNALRTLSETVRNGLSCGPQTGAVLHAALLAADEYAVDDGIVVLSGDAGWKNWDLIINEE